LTVTSNTASGWDPIRRPETATSARKRQKHRPISRALQRWI